MHEPTPYEFEWDKGNHEKNFLKHGVAWYECEQVFFNNPLVSEQERQRSPKERRYHALGQTHVGRFLFIAFTIRINRIRVISARSMNRKERSTYEKTA